MLLSVICTVRNEGENIADLMDSLVMQEQPLEIIIVDAGSDDSTRAIVRDYEKRYTFVKLHEKGGTRGEGRNHGAALARGEALAFIDGDCIANPFWLAEFRKALGVADIVAGRTIMIGYAPFVELRRVELFHQGYDVTHPSSNLCYRKRVFDELGGFDPWFRTAEDIDLNFRAVERGYSIAHLPKAVVYGRARSTFFSFFKQAFWNGYGRKQLTLKHGHLWGAYSPARMFQRDVSPWYLMRLFFALLGYVACKMGRERPDGLHTKK